MSNPVRMTGVEGYFRKLLLQFLWVIISGLLIVGLLIAFIAERSKIEVAQRSLAKNSQELKLYKTAFGATYNASSPSELRQKDLRFRPGWVARVYPPPKDLASDVVLRDVGSFVLDEARFSLMTHENHDIQQPFSATYRLSSFYVADVGGEHQLGVEMRYQFQPGQESELISDAQCRLRGEIDSQPLFDRNVNLSPRGLRELLVSGSAVMPPGLHPIEILISCSEQSYLRGELMQLRIQSRAPGDSALRYVRDRFLHFSGRN